MPNYRILLGAPYLLNASAPEYKALVVSAFSEAGCVPFECLVLSVDAPDAFKSAFSRSVRLAQAYVLLLGPEPRNLPPALSASIKTEQDLVSEKTGLPMFALVYDDEALRRQAELLPANSRRADDGSSGLKIFYWRDDRSLLQAIAQISEILQQTERALPEAIHFDEEDYRDSVCFQGFFYSAAQYCVKDYRIQISRRRLWRDGKTVSPVRIWNFHGRFKSMEFANRVYEGVAYIQSNFLYIDTHKRIQPPDDSLKIRLFFGNLGLDAIGEQEVLFGSAEGLTSAAQNFCNKTIVAQVSDSDASISDSQRLQIERHLLLSRKSFVTKLETLQLNQLPGLTYEGAQVSKIDRLTGTYRIWTEGRKGNNEVVQSKLVVEPNYQAKMYNPIFGEQELVCEVHIGEGLGREKVYFIIRLKDQRSTIATVGIMTLPDPDGMLKVLAGSFCSAGRSQYRQGSAADPHPITEVRGGYFTAMRVEVLEELNNFKPCFLPVSAIIEDSKLLSMYRLLKAENGRPVVSAKRK